MGGILTGCVTLEDWWLDWTGLDCRKMMVTKGRNAYMIHIRETYAIAVLDVQVFIYGMYFCNPTAANESRVLCRNNFISNDWLTSRDAAI